MQLNSKLPLKSIINKIDVDCPREYLGRIKDMEITGIAPIETAKEGDITFLANSSYLPFLKTTKATAVILSADYLDKCKTIPLVAENPRLSLAKLARWLCYNIEQTIWQIHPTAVVGENCNISDTVAIGANCVVGDNVTLGQEVVLEAGVVVENNCKIGTKTVVKSNTTICHGVKIGNRCKINSGTVVGSEGFGYVQEQGQWVQLPHLGGVVIGCDVEIGSNTSIDRGFLNDTVISDNVIIDNLVQIAHNVTIGYGTAIAGCVGIAGSASIGKFCLIGGGVSVAGHISIADNVHITATSAVNRSLIKPGVYSSGLPARENKVWQRNVARFQFLDSMAKRLRDLERMVNSEEHSVNK